MKFLPKLHATIRNLKKQFTSGSDQNPRWPPQASTEKRKSQYLKDRLTDRHEIFVVASCHH